MKGLGFKVILGSIGEPPSRRPFLTLLLALLKGTLLEGSGDLVSR